MKSKFNKKQILYTFKNYSLVIIGTLLIAFGTAIFIIPFDLVTGGVSSIAIILKNLIPIEQISYDIYIFAITWILFFLGLFILGKNFALKTLVSSIVYPFAFSLCSLLLSNKVFHGFFMLEASEYKEIAIILAAIFGGAFVGTGSALTFLGGGSSGGVDVLAFIVCKFVKKVKSSIVIFMIDALTITIGMFVVKDFVLSLLGITSAYICASVIDRLFLGESKAFVAMVVSDKYDEINKEVIRLLDRTTTIFDVEGGYSGNKKRMVMVSFTMNEYSKILRIFSTTDPKAFVTIHRAHEINGEGWTYDAQ